MKMSQATEPREAQGAADDRAQRELTSKVGATLTRRSKPSNGKWGTWKGRLGIRSKTEA
jgi:hypothetical protein